MSVLLKPKEVAARLGISLPTLRRHIKNRNIDYVNIGLGELKVRIGFRESDVAGFEERRLNLGIAPCLPTKISVRRSIPMNS